MTAVPAPPSAGPAERAAITVLMLEESEAAAVLSRLQPGELQQLGAAMCGLEDVEPGAIADALGGFVAEAAREALPAAGDRRPQVQGLMARAVGEGRAGYLMQRIAPDASGRPLEIARWLAPESLLSLIEGEPPQVVAVLLLLLDTGNAARLLALLPAGLQPQVLERVARLDRVPAQAKDLLNALLERRMADRFGAATFRMGGPREAADLINRAAGGMEKQVMPAIAEADPALAGAIEAELVTFAMLLGLDPQSMGRLLREVENAVLVDALKGMDEDARAPVFAAMSARAADGVRDEIELRGRIRRAEVEAAQRTVVATARSLAEAGEIAMGTVDGDLA